MTEKMMKEGFWSYKDLSEAEREALVLVLPEKWEFCGSPGGEIEPVFVCPICEEKCTASGEGCEHFMFVYNCEFYVYPYVDPDFEDFVSRALQTMGIRLPEDPFFVEIGSPAIRPWDIHDLDDKEWPGLDSLLPELKPVHLSKGGIHFGA
jgi:hypothetical protein